MRRARLALLVTACAVASGCPSGCDLAKELVNPTGTSVRSVTVEPLAAQLTVGQTQQFTATVQPDGVSDKSVTWTVSPSNVASVDSKGMLTALAPGQAVVTATTVATPVHNGQSAITIAAATGR
jgi:uncharacterized protein YjdB